MANYIMFTNDERVLINRITMNVNLSKVGKANILKSLNMALLMSADDDIKEMVEGAKEKVEQLTEEEWEELKALIPWDCVDPTEDTMEEGR